MGLIYKITNKINNNGTLIFTGGVNSNVIDSSSGSITAGAGFSNAGSITVNFDNFEMSIQSHGLQLGP